MSILRNRIEANVDFSNVFGVQDDLGIVLVWFFSRLMVRVLFFGALELLSGHLWALMARFEGSKEFSAQIVMGNTAMNSSREFSGSCASRWNQCGLNATHALFHRCVVTAEGCGRC